MTFPLGCELASCLCQEEEADTTSGGRQSKTKQENKTPTCPFGGKSQLCQKQPLRMHRPRFLQGDVVVTHYRLECFLGSVIPKADGRATRVSPDWVPLPPCWGTQATQLRSHNQFIARLVWQCLPPVMQEDAHKNHNTKGAVHVCQLLRGGRPSHGREVLRLVLCLHCKTTSNPRWCTPHRGNLGTREALSPPCRA